jgi:hypothetical protein
LQSDAERRGALARDPGVAISSSEPRESNSDGPGVLRPRAVRIPQGELAREAFSPVSGWMSSSPNETPGQTASVDAYRNLVMTRS